MAGGGEIGHNQLDTQNSQNFTKKKTTKEDIQNVSDNIEKSKILPQILEILEGKIDENKLNDVLQTLKTENIYDLKDIFTRLQNQEDIDVILSSKKGQDKGDIDSSNSSEQIYKGQKSIDKGGKLSLEEQLQSIQNEIDSIANSENPDRKKIWLLKRKRSVIEDKLIAKKDDVIKVENEKQAEENEKQAKLDIIKNSLSTIDLSKYGVDGKENLMTYLNSGDFDKFIHILKNPATLVNITNDLGGVGSEKYESFKKAIIPIDNSFRERFDEIEWGKVELIAQITLGVTNSNGVDISKDTLTKKTDDGFVVEAGKKGRFLSLQNSDYKINANIDNTHERIRFDEIEKNTKKTIAPINENLNSISKILKYVEQSIVIGKKIEDVKENIKNLDLDLYNELNIDSAGSLESIKSILISAYKNKEDGKDEILNKQKELFENLVSQNKNEALEKDKKRKEILKFINTIGLDTVPQSVIQPILEMVSGGNPIHIGNDIITGIDVSSFTFEGTFSPSLGDGGIDDLNSKKVFMKLSNKIMTGEENYPINIDSYTLGSKPSFRWKIQGEENKYEEISDIDLKTRINSNLGSMPDSVIKQNLGWLDEK